MSLSFTGPSGTAEHRWIVYALLRDNVLHHFTSNDPRSPEFESIYSIEQALGGKAIVLSARRLRVELERASTLLALPIDELAVSQRTRAVIDGSWPAPEAESRRTTLQGSAAIPWLSAQARTLDDVFGNLVRSLLSISSGAGEADLVEVVDS